MKTLRTLIVITIAIFGFNTTSFGQTGVKATATASSTIITPIKITKTVDMNFGNVAVNATDGTVILTTAGGRSATGGVTVSSAIGGTIAAASFTVEGLGSSTYSITLPTTHTIKNTTGSGAETMVVSTFLSDPGTSGTLSSEGSQTLNVGATLNVTGGQVPGVYVSEAPFEVKVNYN